MKRLSIVAVSFLMALSAHAQQALYGGPQVESPVINADGTVTFRYQAPKAVKVEVTGDFLPTEKEEVEFNGQKMAFDAPGVGVLKEGQNGVWEYTTPFKVAPELYNYTFQVDGNTVIDPNNMWVNRDVASLTSVLLVPEDLHGNLHQIVPVLLHRHLDGALVPVPIQFHNLRIVHNCLRKVSF